MTNQLANESSLYLLQHANNPVNWYPWGKQALSEARKKNMPILLSIGYSACHWCHVMARESFSDEETAKLMNENFLNIKVDREELPDLDKIYQSAHYLLTQRSGGWPLTVFLLPNDLTPFFAGTFFPKEPRYGMPSFKEVLSYIHKMYTQKQAVIRNQSKQFRETLEKIYSSRITQQVLDNSPLQKVIPQFYQSYDWEYGGFGDRPKFPDCTSLELLLHQGLQNCDDKSVEMVRFTLTKMARSGLYDHLASGFYRYSVDRQWAIPHFEKMLYDNAQLLALYSLSFAATHENLFKHIGLEVANWLLTEMKAEQGGFYSTMSAETGGEEGKYYIWSPQQLSKILSEQEKLLIMVYFSLDQAPNFEGNWHLQIKASLATVAKSLQLSQKQAKQILKSAKDKLHLARNLRSKPEVDTKILTSWNGLTIKALCLAGMHFQKKELIVQAQRAVDFIQNNMWVEHRLLASYKDKRAKIKSYLDDYAFLLDAIVALLQAKWRTSDLHFAVLLAENLLTHFNDQTNGGFYFTADDHQTPMIRPKYFADEAIPAGNGYAATALFRLGYLLGEPRYIQAAERTLKSAWENLIKQPSAHSSLLIALEELLIPPTLIILRGNLSQIALWQESIRKQFHLHQLCFAIADDEINLPETLRSYKKVDTPTAYVCQGYQCLPAISQLSELLTLLDSQELKKSPY